MNSKTIILFFMIPIFIGKLIVLDASFINIISPSEVSFEKVNCMKDQVAKDLKTSLELKKPSKPNNRVILVNGFCNPQLYFSLYTWLLDIVEKTLHLSIKFDDSLSYIFIDSQSPPPKLA